MLWAVLQLPLVEPVGRCLWEARGRLVHVVHDHLWAERAETPILAIFYRCFEDFKTVCVVSKGVYGVWNPKIVTLTTTPFPPELSRTRRATRPAPRRTSAGPRKARSAYEAFFSATILFCNVFTRYRANRVDFHIFHPLFWNQVNPVDGTYRKQLPNPSGVSDLASATANCNDECATR